jgi:hypothetical protein
MIWNEGPGIAVGAGFRQQLMQALNKVGAVIIIVKDIATFNSADDNMVEKVGAVDAWLSGHAERITELKH